MKSSIERVNAPKCDDPIFNFIGDHVTRFNANGLAYFFRDGDLSFTGNPADLHIQGPLLFTVKNTGLRVYCQEEGLSSSVRIPGRD